MDIIKHYGMQITNYVANSHIIWECSYLNFSKSEEDSDSFPEFSMTINVIALPFVENPQSKLKSRIRH